MKKRKWPWVRRREHERVVRTLTDLVLRHSTDASRATKELEVEHERFIRQLGELSSLVKRAEAQSDMAERRAAAAEERSVTAIAEARKALGESVSLSRLAATALFGGDQAGDVEAGTSVRTNDAAYARRQREAKEQGR